jgi:hypothetical protein
MEKPKKSVVVWYSIIEDKLFLKVPTDVFGRIPSELQDYLKKVGSFEGIGNVLMLVKSNQKAEDIVKTSVKRKDKEYIFLPAFKNLMKEKDYQDFQEKILILSTLETYQKI